jgi:hypothetical protein
VFEKRLEAKFKAIFDFPKVTFDQPGESREQECLFIEVENPVITVKDGRAVGRIYGNAIVFASNSKLPFGYFQKRIQAASYEETKDLFFSEVEENTKTYRDLVQRGFRFVYFFNSQYDPEVGTIDSMNFQRTE